MLKSNGAASAEITPTKRFASFREIADFLWQNAERMRGVYYEPNEYNKVDDPQFQDIAFWLLVKRIYDKIRGGKGKREAVGG